MPIIMVVGSPGAGKTAVTEAAKRKGVQTIQIGTLMEEEAVRRHYIKNRDEIRHMLSPKMQGELQRHAFAKLSRMKGKIVVDTHMSVQSRGRYVPGIPYSCLRMVKGIAAWVYIDADTDEILRRRRKDKTRKKDLDSRHNIEMQRTANLSMLFYCAWRTNAPVYIIYNRDGTLKTSAARFKRVLSEAFGA